MPQSIQCEIFTDDDRHIIVEGTTRTDKDEQSYFGKPCSIPDSETEWEYASEYGTGNHVEITDEIEGLADDAEWVNVDEADY